MEGIVIGMVEIMNLFILDLSSFIVECEMKCCVFWILFVVDCWFLFGLYFVRLFDDF